MGDTAIIYANNKDKTVTYEILIDTKNLDKVKEIEGKWCVAHDKNGKIGWVVCFSRYKNGKKLGKDIRLHKLIMKYDGKLPIDHIDRNPLNNKEENLRLSTIAKNGQNRAVGSNSRIGVRGLNWNKNAKKYQARVQFNGKRKTIGFFENIEEGEKALREYRVKNTSSID